MARNVPMPVLAAIAGGLFGAAVTASAFLVFDDEDTRVLERVIEEPEEEVAFPPLESVLPTAPERSPQAIESCSELPGPPGNTTVFGDLSLDGFHRRVIYVFGYEDGTGYRLIADEPSDLEDCDPNLVAVVEEEPPQVERVVGYQSDSSHFDGIVGMAISQDKRVNSLGEVEQVTAGQPYVIVATHERFDTLTFEFLRDRLEEGSVIAVINVSERDLREKAGLTGDTADFDAALANSLEARLADNVPGYSFIWIKRVNGASCVASHAFEIGESFVGHLLFLEGALEDEQGCHFLS